MIVGLVRDCFRDVFAVGQAATISSHAATSRPSWRAIVDAGGDPVDIGLCRMSAAGQRRLDDLPVSAVARDRDRAELVGAQQGNPVRPQQAERLRVRMAVIIVPARGWPRPVRAGRSGASVRRSRCGCRGGPA